MALAILNTMVPRLWLYLSCWWNEVSFSSTRITFDGVQRWMNVNQLSMEFKTTVHSNNDVMSGLLLTKHDRAKYHAEWRLRQTSVNRLYIHQGQKSKPSAYWFMSKLAWIWYMSHSGFAREFDLCKENHFFLVTLGNPHHFAIDWVEFNILLARQWLYKTPK